MTRSPCRVTISRSTPCVAGWCGPMLIVRISCSGSSPGCRSSASVTSAKASTIAADREVATLWPADVVLRHQDPAEVGVPHKDDPEEVVGLPLLKFGGREKIDA